MKKLKKKISYTEERSCICFMEDHSIKICDKDDIRELCNMHDPEMILVNVVPNEAKYVRITKVLDDIDYFHIEFDLYLCDSSADDDPIFEKVDSINITCTNYLDIYRFVFSLYSIYATNSQITFNDFDFGAYLFVIKDPIVELRKRGKVKYSGRFNPDNSVIGEVNLRDFVPMLNGIFDKKNNEIFTVPSDDYIIDIVNNRWEINSVSFDDGPFDIDIQYQNDNYLFTIINQECGGIAFSRFDDIMSMSLVSSIMLELLVYSENQAKRENVPVGWVRNIQSMQEDIYSPYDTLMYANVRQYGLLTPMSNLMFAEVYLDVINIISDVVWGAYADDTCIQISALLPHEKNVPNRYYFYIRDFSEIQYSIYDQFISELIDVINGELPSYAETVDDMHELPTSLPF